MTNPDRAELAYLADWLAQLERMTGATYGFLDLSLSQLRLETLKTLRLKIEGNLAALNRLIRLRSDAERDALVEPHLSALLAIKLLRDDLLLVSLEYVRAQSKSQTETDTKQAALRNDYEPFLRSWVEASPLIHPETVKWLWPNVKNHKNSPTLRGLDAMRPPATPDDLVAPIELARTAIKQESEQFVTSRDASAFSRRTIHLIGIAFIFAQVELAKRFSNDGSYQRYASSWYDAAENPADTISELLGCLDRPIREAIRDDDALLRNKLEPARRGMLTVLALSYSVPALECATLAGFSKGTAKPTEVVGVNNVTEKVTERPGLIRGDQPQAPNEMLGFMAATGFPLIYPQRDVKDPPGRPPMRWGRIARLVMLDATREYWQHEEQSVFSFAETVTEQHELIADFMTLEPVRKEFAPALKRQPTLDLVNRTTRGRVLALATRSLATQATPSEALTALIPLIQRYLSFFTRHTGGNLRDSGTPYLSSQWPTDLNGRQFFDCGVYAVETAFDLMRAANGTKGLALEFRFLVFPEHVCLVAYEGQTSFAVNNGHVYPPTPFPTGAQAQPKDAAGMSWARLAMQDALSAHFAIVLVALHPRTLSSKQSEAAFKNAIWRMYQSITGLGIAKALDKAYFDSAKAFDLGSTLLAGFLLELTVTIGKLPSQAELADSWTRATDLAAKLYELAQTIALPCNYTDSKEVGFLFAIGAHVSDNDGLVDLAKLNHKLPMYEFVRLLKASGRTLSTAQQQLAARSTGEDHLEELTNALHGKCDAKTIQALAVTHAVLQGEVAKLILGAPQRIRDRLKAVGSPSG